MNEIKVNVSFEKRTLSIEGVSLVSGDYNSTKLSFIFDKEYEGRKIFELARPNTDEAIFVKEIENNEVILVAYEDGVEKSIFNEVGKYPFEVTLYGNDSKLTSLSGKLRIAKEAVKVGDEVVERYMPVFDQLMQETTTAINGVKEVQKAVEEAETIRKEAEESRVLAEISRTEAEENRKTTENTRVENEQTRQASETERGNAETTRQDNEVERAESELVRKENEETRNNNEATRINNENIRILNEEAREGKLAVLDNLMKDMTVEGNSLHVTDSAEWYGKLNIKGVSNQEKRSGKNKLRLTVGEYKFNGVTIKIEEDGLITLNGTVSANYPTIKLTNGLEGIIALDYVHTSDWINEDVGIVGDFTLEKYIIGGNATTTYPAVSMFNQDAERIAITGKSTTLNSFTTNSNLACLVLYLGDNTITYNNFQFYLMIEEGIKTEISAYEAYGATPSPEFRSEIQNVEGNVEVRDTGKNIININNLHIGFIQSDGIPTNYQTMGEMYSDFIKVIPNTTYVFEILETTSNYPNWFAVGEYISNSYDTFIRRGVNTNTTATSIVFTTGANTNYVSVSARNLCEVKKIQMYDKSQEQTITFPLSSGQKLIKGSDLADNGIHDLRNQVILDGTENWTAYKNGSVTNYYIQSGFLTNVGSNENVLCNYFQTITQSSYTADKIYVFSSLNGGLSVFVDNTDERFSSLENFKNWLAEQYAGGTPVKVQYKLATPKITPYTTKQQEAYNQLQHIKTYRNLTNITTNSNAIIELTYKKDLQKQLDELQALILETGV